MVVLASPTTPGYKITDNRYRCAYAMNTVVTLYNTTKETVNGALSTGGSRPITFNYADTIDELILPVTQQSSGIGIVDQDLVTVLTEKKGACTISIATPGVVTFTGHGLVDGQTVQFSTTGALPTGVTAVTSAGGNYSSLYFVKVVSADTFWLYNTKANALAGGTTGRINTSGTQSGVHSLRKEIAYERKTPSQIMGVDSTTTENHYGYWFARIPLTTPIAVTTDASKYRLNICNYYNANSNLGFSVYYGAATGLNALACAFVGQTTVVPTSGVDFPIFREKCILDTSWNFTATRSAPSGLTNNNGYDGWVCPGNYGLGYEENIMIDIPPTISSQITLDFEAGLFFSNGAGFRIGLQNQLMPNNMVKIMASVATVGTSGGFIRGYANVYFYGKAPIQPEATLSRPIWGNIAVTFSSATDKATTTAPLADNGVPVFFKTSGALPSPLAQNTIYYLQNKSGSTYDIYNKNGVKIDMTTAGSGTHTINACVCTTDAMTERTVNSTIYPDRDQVNGSSYIGTTISDISSDYKVFAGNAARGVSYPTGLGVINMEDGIGIKFDTASTLTGRIMIASLYNHLHIEGFSFKNYLTSRGVSDITDQKWSTQPYIKNAFGRGQYAVNVLFNASSYTPTKGIYMENIYGVNCQIIGIILMTNYRRKNVNYSSGDIVMRNIWNKAGLVGWVQTGSANAIRWDIKDLRFNNASNYHMRTGVNSRYENCKFMCIAPNVSGKGTIQYGNCVNPTSIGDMVDSTIAGYFDIGFDPGSVVLGMNMSNPKLNTLYAPQITYNIFTDGSCYIESNINNGNSEYSIREIYQDNMSKGSFIKQNAYSGGANNYSIYLQKGKGLKDISTIKNGTSSLQITTNQQGLVTLGKITFVAKSGVTYKIPGNFRYDTNFESGIIQYPKISISDGVITPVTFTASASLPDNWQPFLLEVTQSSGVDTVMTIDITGGSTDATGRFWVDGIAQYPYINATRFYGYKFDEGSIMKTIDPIIVLDETGAGALSSKMSIDFDTNTLTITGSVSLSNIYDFIKYSLCLPANLARNDIISSPDGVIFNGSFNLNLTSTAQITGGGTLTIGANTLSIASGATSTAQLVSDDASFTSLSVSGLVAGSRIQLYNATDDIEIYNAIVAGTSWSTGIAWTENKQIRLRVIKNDGLTAYQMFESTGTFLQTGLAFNAAQLVNKIYNDNNIDGSTVTECSISGTIVRIYVDDPDNLTTWQKIYNWYQSYLATEAGIREQNTSYFYAIDTTTYKCSDTMRIINQDITNPLAITGGNCSPDTAPIQNIVDTSNGASIVVLSDRVVDASGKIGGITDSLVVINHGVQKASKLIPHSQEL